MKNILKSWRTHGLYLLPLLLIVWLVYTDPDRGLATRDMLTGAISGVIAVTVAHLMRKALFDYVKMEGLARKAAEHPIGAGLVYLGICVVLYGLLGVFGPRAHAQDVRTFVPAGALKYAPMLKTEQARLWPTHPAPEMLAALVEVESCITLRNPRCWNPGAKLRTAREEGAGFGQITRAYRSDGSERFDALSAAKALDPGLAEWSWSNVYSRPDLQLRAIVTMNRDCARRLAPMVTDARLRADLCDAAYNGGYGGMQAERRACGQRPGCDPQRWFANVERVCLKSKTVQPGYGRSACQINRDHVRDVSIIRAPKYRALMT